MKSSRDQRHEYPGQKRDDAGVEHGIGDKKMPRTNRRADGQIQYRCDGKDSEKSGNRHLPFRQPLHRLAWEREPAFQAAEFLHAPAPFRQLDGKLIPLQVFRRRTKRRERLPVRELANDAVFVRGAPRPRSNRFGMHHPLEDRLNQAVGKISVASKDQVNLGLVRALPTSVRWIKRVETITGTNSG